MNEAIDESRECILTDIPNTGEVYIMLSYSVLNAEQEKLSSKHIPHIDVSIRMPELSYMPISVSAIRRNGEEKFIS